MFDFSRGDFDGAIVKLKNILAVDAQNFDAQLALGMAFYRKGDFAAAIAEGTRPRNFGQRSNSSIQTSRCST